jgi:hypothetical protein
MEVPGRGALGLPPMEIGTEKLQNRREGSPKIEKGKESFTLLMSPQQQRRSSPKMKIA